MRTLIHLSDLHFGSLDEATVSPLKDAIERISPNLIAISGDLTQRARTAQFRSAKGFLDSLPFPKIVVPGNHDIPAYDPFARFLRPLEKYRRYISDDLHPFYLDGEIAVAGVNTARSFAIRNGRINETQMNWVNEKLGTLGSDVLKIVVSHHPFDLPEGHNPRWLAGRSRIALQKFGNHVDIFLAGHLHVGRAGIGSGSSTNEATSALVLQAGTATSTRRRGETNSFNALRIDRSYVAIEQFRWNPKKTNFEIFSTERFLRGTKGWAQDPKAALLTSLPQPTSLQ